ncbi:ImpA family type VI secretion system protein [Sphingomonas paucimobilis]|uniref:type VI secretion system protein TssA n=1 Tax=Sphingomonas paucimobilis TaxID=13689 RepID=UPI002430CD4C|nr:type VI secretion system ImpA family N-terminal domain-containing protein [Sphingomonas paucimobilis]
MAPSIDIADLLTPIAPDAPAGPDLSYDPARQAIEQAFSDPADEVDWPRTIVMIEAQARQTRDVWLAVYLARAGARAGDLAVVETGVQLLAGLFERLWDSAHPTIEEYGIEGRKGACESLVRIGEFLAPLRRVPLIVHPRLGQYDGADVERFSEDGMADGYGPFRAALADTPVERIEAIVDRFRRIEAALQRADAVLSEKAEEVGQTATNFRPTYEAIEGIVHALTPFVRQTGEAAAADDAMPITLSDGPRPMGSGGVGRIQSREDVARALDAVIDYYGRVEPSSPIPVALGRVKGWITMDFMAILADIAPGSVSDATAVLRARAEAEASADLM